MSEINEYNLIDPTYLEKFLSFNKENPINICKIINYCKSNKLFYKLSRNVIPFGCKDASFKRIYNGKIGISLERELKTIVCYIINRNNLIEYIVINCKGSDRIDFLKIKKILNAKKIELVSTLLLKTIFNMEFGTVNPFLIQTMTKIKIIQIIQQKLLNTNEKYKTMMTNAGDRTWGILFKRLELFNFLLNSNKKNISTIVIDF